MKITMSHYTPYIKYDLPGHEGYAIMKFSTGRWMGEHHSPYGPNYEMICLLDNGKSDIEVVIACILHERGK